MGGGGLFCGSSCVPFFLCSEVLQGSYGCLSKLFNKTLCIFFLCFSFMQWFIRGFFAGLAALPANSQPSLPRLDISLNRTSTGCPIANSHVIEPAPTGNSSLTGGPIAKSHLTEPAPARYLQEPNLNRLGNYNISLNLTSTFWKSHRTGPPPVRKVKASQGRL